MNKKTKKVYSKNILILTCLLSACGKDMPTEKDLIEDYNEDPKINVTEMISADIQLQETDIDKYEYRAEAELTLKKDLLKKMPIYDIANVIEKNAGDIDEAIKESFTKIENNYKDKYNFEASFSDLLKPLYDNITQDYNYIADMLSNSSKDYYKVELKKNSNINAIIRGSVDKNFENWKFNYTEVDVDFPEFETLKPTDKMYTVFDKSLQDEMVEQAKDFIKELHSRMSLKFNKKIQKSVNRIKSIVDDTGDVRAYSGYIKSEDTGYVPMGEDREHSIDVLLEFDKLNKSVNTLDFTIKEEDAWENKIHETGELKIGEQFEPLIVSNINTDEDSAESSDLHTLNGKLSIRLDDFNIASFSGNFKRENVNEIYLNPVDNEEYQGIKNVYLDKFKKKQEFYERISVGKKFRGKSVRETGSNTYTDKFTVEIIANNGDDKIRTKFTSLNNNTVEYSNGIIGRVEGQGNNRRGFTASLGRGNGGMYTLFGRRIENLDLVFWSNEDGSFSGTERGKNKYTNRYEIRLEPLK